MNQRFRDPAFRAEVVVLVAFAIGASAGLAFLTSVFPAFVVPIAVALVTAAYALRKRWKGPRRSDRVLGGAALLVLVTFHALWTYLACSWGLSLAWTIQPWGWALIVPCMVLALVTVVRPIAGAHLPVALPLGLFVAFGLLGWEHEESRLRCDDYLELRRVGAASLVVATSELEASCTPGRVIPIGRYPRFPWQSADGSITLFTTSARGPEPVRPDLPLTGSVCRLEHDGSVACVGEGKAQGVAESVALDRIFVATWSRFAPGVRARVLAIPRTGAFEIERTLDVSASLAELFYDAHADRLYGFTDEGFEIIPIVASTLEREPSLSTELLPPGAILYDAARGEGLVCVTSGPFLDVDGASFLAIATRGDPLTLRPIGTSALARLSLSWGCDYDPVARTTFVTIPNLGLLARIDYDSGELVDTTFVGLDIRGVTIDAPRERVYLTMFLSGQVVAIDTRTMREVERWAVGRFPRRTLVSFDRRSLLVGTTLGLASIALAP